LPEGPAPRGPVATLLATREGDTIAYERTTFRAMCATTPDETYPGTVTRTSTVVAEDAASRVLWRAETSRLHGSAEALDCRDDGERVRRLALLALPSGERALVVERAGAFDVLDVRTGEPSTRALFAARDRLDPLDERIGPARMRRSSVAAVPGRATRVSFRPPRRAVVLAAPYPDVAIEVRASSGRWQTAFVQKAALGASLAPPLGDIELSFMDDAAEGLLARGGARVVVIAFELAAAGLPGTPRRLEVPVESASPSL
jgi:hypothetical protein